MVVVTATHTHMARDSLNRRTARVRQTNYAMRDQSTALQGNNVKHGKACRTAVKVAMKCIVFRQVGVSVSRPLGRTERRYQHEGGRKQDFINTTLAVPLLNQYEVL